MNQVKPKAKVAKITTNEGIIIVNEINKMQSKSYFITLLFTIGITIYSSNNSNSGAVINTIICDI